MESNIKQLEFILNEMRAIQEEYPKARVYFDWQNKQIVISFPLSKDYFEIKDIKFY